MTVTWLHCKSCGNPWPEIRLKFASPGVEYKDNNGCLPRTVTFCKDGCTNMFFTPSLLQIKQWMRESDHSEEAIEQWLQTSYAEMKASVAVPEAMEICD